MPSVRPFAYKTSAPLTCDPYVRPVVVRQVERFAPAGGRVLDIGCGNGSLAGHLHSLGYAVTGLEPSEEGITIARREYPGCDFHPLGANPESVKRLQAPPFDVVVSTEVIEHLYDPSELLAAAYAALKPGGRIVVSTPYHGWLKNTLIAVTNKYDGHVNPLYVGGHIKFFSEQTLGQLFAQAGFASVELRGAGRLPRLWKSMIMTARRAD